MYDYFGSITVRTVIDHSSALACSRQLDGCAKRMEKLFPKFLQAGADHIAQDGVRKLGANLYQRLLRRSEHWKAEAHRRHEALLQQDKQTTSGLALTRRRRLEIIKKYRVEHSLTMDELARCCHTLHPRSTA